MRESKLSQTEKNRIALEFPICNSGSGSKNGEARKKNKQQQKSQHRIAISHYMQKKKATTKQPNKTKHKTMTVQMNTEVSLPAEGFSAPCCFTVIKTKLRHSDLNSYGKREFPTHSVLGPENLSGFQQDEPCKMSKPRSSVCLLAIDKDGGQVQLLV